MPSVLVLKSSHEGKNGQKELFLEKKLLIYAIGVIMYQIKWFMFYFDPQKNLLPPLLYGIKHPALPPLLPGGGSSRFMPYNGANIL